MWFTKAHSKYQGKHSAASLRCCFQVGARSIRCSALPTALAAKLAAHSHIFVDIHSHQYSACWPPTPGLQNSLMSSITAAPRACRGATVLSPQGLQPHCSVYRGSCRESMKSPVLSRTPALWVRTPFYWHWVRRRQLLEKDSKSSCSWWQLWPAAGSSANMSEWPYEASLQRNLLVLPMPSKQVL